MSNKDQKKTSKTADAEVEQERYEEALAALAAASEKAYIQAEKYSKEGKDDEVDRLLSENRVALFEVSRTFDKLPNVVARDLELRNPATDEALARFKAEAGDAKEGMVALSSMHAMWKFVAQQAVDDIYADMCAFFTGET